MSARLRRARGRRYRRRSVRGINLALIVLLVAFCGFTWVVWLAAHVAVLGATAAAVACAFWAGRRHEQRTAYRPATPARGRPADQIRAVPDPADQVALLERTAGRPMDAIIASYQLIQRRYGGPR